MVDSLLLQAMRQPSSSSNPTNRITHPLIVAISARLLARGGKEDDLNGHGDSRARDFSEPPLPKSEGQTEL